MPSTDETSLTVPALIRHLAAEHGDREMLITRERRMSYAQVERESSRLARGLIAAGVGKGTRVAVLMPNGPDWVLAWLAASRAGAIVIPLSTFYQARELHWVLRHADVHTLLTCDRYLSHDYLARLEEIAPKLREQDGEPLRLPELPHLRAVRVWGDGDRTWASREPAALTRLADATPAVDEPLLREVEDCISPADLAVIIYTSGSTAEPKGAVHTHGTVVRHSRLVASFLPTTPEDATYAPPPFFWVGGFHRLVHTLHGGGRMVFSDSFEPGDALDVIQRERVTTLVVWPHQAKALCEHPSFERGDYSFIHTGPIAMLPKERRPPTPDRIPNRIGMTETFAYHTIEPANYLLPPEKRGACGRALPGLERRISNPETGEPVLPDQEGELWVRGFNLMQGLYKREREDVFTPDGWYRTGDRGRIDADGVYFFNGRLGDMIKTGGANVSPREVEIVLGSFEEIEQAHVVGVPDSELGERVVAALVPVPGVTLDLDELRGRLRTQLSAFKVPRQMIVLAVSDLPLTDSGKLHGARLRDELASRLS